VVVFYTDVLVERRGEHIDEGLARLATTARSIRDRAVEDICRELVLRLRQPTSRSDDVALVVVRLSEASDGSFEFRFPPRSESLRGMRVAVHEWLERRGLDAARRDAVVLAVAEACANAVEHAYVDSPAADIRVMIWLNDDAVLIEVVDAGSWQSTPHADPDRGRGYGIMRALADGVEVDSGPDGTSVRMHFSR
jgi:anti-sigma regulatory factor (Ser/Thr protein kinase)